MESYVELMGQQPDIRVTYRLYSVEEGGRWSLPNQHIRWDFRYEDNAISTGTWMIWPEFIDLDGETLPLGPVPMMGQANMFCFSTEMQDFHRQHIEPGVRGYFVEGSHRVGVCEVVEVLALHRNPKAQAG